jgi:hypothetical protein
MDTNTVALLIKLAGELPLVAAFIWFTLRVMDIYEKQSSARDAEWRAFIQRRDTEWQSFITMQMQACEYTRNAFSQNAKEVKYVRQ